MSKSFYITTPLYYVNAPPSWGAYTTIVADTVRRYKKMLGIDVHLVTGTDEHGQKIERSARAQGISPKELADRVAAQYRDLWERLGIQYDTFIRTTDERHVPAVHELYRRAKAAGYIYKGQYSGWYCVSDEAYAPESDPAKPVNCPDCGRPTEWFSEESYFFKLSSFTDRLLEYYERHPDFIRPVTRRNEIVSFVKGGLRDLSISRATLKWGIPLPDDPKHVFYVWFDALTGYLSAIGFGTDEALFQRYWPAGLHLVGKEIVRFHTVYWPAFLMAADLPVPECVFGHGFWLASGEKMSKSRGNVVDPFVLNDVFGSEALRYFLLREMVFGQDCNFSFEALVQRANSDLANGLGNLLSRTTAMISKYRGGRIPPHGAAKGDAGVRELAARVMADYRANLDDCSFSRALENVWELISRVDKYIVENEPWVLAASPGAAGALDSVLFHSAEALRLIAAMLAPALPRSAQAIWEQLGLDGVVADTRLNDLAWSNTLEGKAIRPGAALFPRLDAKEVFKKLDTAAGEAPAAESSAAAAPAEAASAVPPIDATITIDDFAKIDLRVGTVLEAERVKGADKLLRLMVDIGIEKRQIVAGIATAYAPEALIGRKVVIVANLQPRKLRGLESNGMVVAASLGSGDKPTLIGLLEDVANGARLR
ncbi:MAG TPA: methionine--tRNA ligase [Terriglobia bacterium]|nr:methionine--tRNA ligase [Terriglobia bacterium]